MWARIFPFGVLIHCEIGSFFKSGREKGYADIQPTRFTSALISRKNSPFVSVELQTNEHKSRNFPSIFRGNCKVEYAMGNLHVVMNIVALSDEIVHVSSNEGKKTTDQIEKERKICLARVHGYLF